MVTRVDFTLMAGPPPRVRCDLGCGICCGRARLLEASGLGSRAQGVAGWGLGSLQVRILEPPALSGGGLQHPRAGLFRQRPGEDTLGGGARASQPFSLSLGCT